MSLPTDNGDVGGSTGGSTGGAGGGEFPHRLEWQMLSWDELTPAQQAEARRRNSIECKVGHLQDNAAITRANTTTGDLVSVNDLIPLIAEMWAKKSGFTAAPRKDEDGKIVLHAFTEGIAATIQYTELLLISLPSLAGEGERELPLPSDEILVSWFLEHEDLLEEPNAMVGGYLNGAKEIFEINISVVFDPDQEEAARRLCEDGNQIAAWDFSANGGKGGEVATGGTGIHPKPTSSL